MTNFPDSATRISHVTPGNGFGKLRGVSMTELKNLLREYRSGKAGEDALIDFYMHRAVLDLGFANLDTHRALRKGFPEVIFGERKTPQQVTRIATELFKRHGRVLITRVNEEHVRSLKRRFKTALHHRAARCVTLEKKPLPKYPGTVNVLCAGTSDVPVAEEAAITLDIMGHHVARLYDVGVAGLHRLLDQARMLDEANVNIVVAGMEGALPSVVAGLTRKPVIAVPTSVGYGASFGGVAALLGMLNSCGSGVTVVNIDNGFGAGYAAAQINSLVGEHLSAMADTE